MLSLIQDQSYVESQDRRDEVSSLKTSFVRTRSKLLDFFPLLGEIILFIEVDPSLKRQK